MPTELDAVDAAHTAVPASLHRVRRLLGDDSTEALRRARVIVFGVGGVGSWAVESLVRTGVGHVTMVDADCVAESNINRQLPATALTVGEVKVAAMRRRMLEINPDADIRALCCRYTPETAADFHLEEYDVVIDAIDSLADKAALILHATATRGVTFLSSMGAALKSDPTRIRVDEFWHVKGCPLAAALRRRFRKTGALPRRRFRCVWSDELLTNLGPDEQPADATSAPMDYGKVAVNGALCHITAIFGFTLAGLAVKAITAAK